MPDTVASIRHLMEDKTDMILSSCSLQFSGERAGFDYFTIVKNLLYLNILNEEKTDGVLGNEVQTT